MHRQGLIEEEDEHENLTDSPYLPTLLVLKCALSAATSDHLQHLVLRRGRRLFRIE